MAGAAACFCERLEPDETGPDQARVGPELGGNDADEVAPGRQRLLRDDFPGRLEQQLARLPEATADDDELGIEDVDEAPDPGAEAASELSHLCQR